MRSIPHQSQRLSSSAIVQLVRNFYRYFQWLIFPGYNNMKKYELSIKDCDAALKLDEGYIKALNRRATAKEELDDLRGALLGMQQT